MSSTGNQLHGITLADILDQLVLAYGWDELGKRIQIRCFNNDPTVKSSLTFLRRTPWARAEVEALFLEMKRKPPPARAKLPSF